MFGHKYTQYEPAYAHATTLSMDRAWAWLCGEKKLFAERLRAETYPCDGALGRCWALVRARDRPEGCCTRVYRPAPGDMHGELQCRWPRRPATPNRTNNTVPCTIPSWTLAMGRSKSAAARFAGTLCTTRSAQVTSIISSGPANRRDSPSVPNIHWEWPTCPTATYRWRRRAGCTSAAAAGGGRLLARLAGALGAN